MEISLRQRIQHEITQECYDFYINIIQGISDINGDVTNSEMLRSYYFPDSKSININRHLKEYKNKRDTIIKLLKTIMPTNILLGNMFRLISPLNINYINIINSVIGDSIYQKQCQYIIENIDILRCRNINCIKDRDIIALNNLLDRDSVYYDTNYLYDNSILHRKEIDTNNRELLDTYANMYGLKEGLAHQTLFRLIHKMYISPIDIFRHIIFTSLLTSFSYNCVRIWKSGGLNEHTLNVYRNMSIDDMKNNILRINRSYQESLLENTPDIYKSGKSGNVPSIRILNMVNNLFHYAPPLTKSMYIWRMTTDTNYERELRVIQMHHPDIINNIPDMKKIDISKSNIVYTVMGGFSTSIDPRVGIGFNKIVNNQETKVILKIRVPKGGRFLMPSVNYYNNSKDIRDYLDPELEALLNHGTRLHFTSVTKNPLLKRARYSSDGEPVSRIANQPENIIDYTNYNECSGTVENNDRLLYGYNTKFRKELKVDDSIIIGNFIGKVDRIESDKLLILDKPISKNYSDIKILRKSNIDWWFIECEMLITGNEKDNHINDQYLGEEKIEDFEEKKGDSTISQIRRSSSTNARYRSRKIKRTNIPRIRKVKSLDVKTLSRKKYGSLRRTRSEGYTRTSHKSKKKRRHKRRYTDYESKSDHQVDGYINTGRERQNWIDIRGIEEHNKLLVIRDTPQFYRKYYNVLNRRGNIKSGYDKMGKFITPDNFKYGNDLYTIIKHEFYSNPVYNLMDIPYYLVIFNNKILHSIRDLNENHIDMLEDVMDIFKTEIKDIEHSDIPFDYYFHYYPTYFRLHMHIRQSGDCIGCTNTENTANLLNDPKLDNRATTIRKGYPVQYIIKKILEQPNYFKVSSLYLEIEETKLNRINEMMR